LPVTEENSENPPAYTLGRQSVTQFVRYYWQNEKEFEKEKIQQQPADFAAGWEQQQQQADWSR